MIFQKRPAIFAIAIVLLMASCNQSKTSDAASEDSTINITDTTSAKVAVTEDRLIVPGKSIGLTYLEEKADSVIAALGKPDSGDAAMGKSIQFWFSKDKKDVTMVYFSTDMGTENASPRAKQVSVSSASFKTRDGISTGSTFNSIKSIYTDLKKIGTYPQPGTNEKITVFNDPSGIAIDINTSNRCIAITVIKPGKDPSQTYLAVHPKWEKR